MWSELLLTIRIVAKTNCATEDHVGRDAREGLEISRERFGLANLARIDSPERRERCARFLAFYNLTTRGTSISRIMRFRCVLDFPSHTSRIASRIAARNRACVRGVVLGVVMNERTPSIPLPDVRGDQLFDQWTSCVSDPRFGNHTIRLMLAGVAHTFDMQSEGGIGEPDDLRVRTEAIV
jgi:hypothetical protein